MSTGVAEEYAKSDLGVELAFGKLLKTIEDRKVRRRPEIPIMLSRLNEEMWGFPRRELTVIGARPGEGKTTLALNLAYYTAKWGLKTDFHSLEMSEEALLSRLCSLELQINQKEIKSGQFSNPDDWERVKNFYNDHLRQIPLTIAHNGARTLADLKASIQVNKPDIVFVDYIQNITKLAKDDRNALSDYIHGAYDLAHQYNLHMVICSQCHRAESQRPDREPTKEDLKGSGAIEETADNIILLHWPHFWDRALPRSDFTMILEKQRNGATFKETIQFTPEYFQFLDCPGSVKI